MSKLTRLLKHVFQLVVLAVAALIASKNDPDLSRLSAHSSAGSGGSGGGGNMKEAYDKIVAAVPDGATVKYADFQKQVGTDITSLLPGASPDSITRNGKRITIDSPSPTSQSLGSGELKLATRVEFDLASPNGALELSKIKGVQVSITSGAPALDLKQVTIVKDAGGNTTISGKMLVSRFLPYLPFKFTFDPSGQLVSGK